jgi:dCTP diphosphatase
LPDHTAPGETSQNQSLTELRDRLREFARLRDWDQFHCPKNLAMALMVESGEIAEILQWKTLEESRAVSNAELSSLKEEVGDVLNYLVRLCDKLDIDPVEAAFEKLQLNEGKYPVEKAKGNSKKYTEL